METTVERIVIMPATVGRWPTNLQPFSVLRSFEQAQVKRIDALFDIERTITGRSAGERLAHRKETSAPIVGELESWRRQAGAASCRGWPDLADDVFAGLRHSLLQIVVRLKIHPELGAGSEKSSEPQSGLRRDASAAGKYLGDAVGRHLQLRRERIGREP